MKKILPVLTALALFGCGGSDSTTDTPDVPTREQQLTRVSVGSQGEQANNFSTGGDAASGLLAFFTAATNLAPGATGNDAMVRDEATGAVRRIAPCAGSGAAIIQRLSADGRYLALQTTVALVDQDTNGVMDVYRIDLSTGDTRLVSQSTDGIPGDNASQRPTMSSDGRFVVFDSTAVNLVPNDTNTASDIFMRDMETSLTTRLSVAQDGSQANGASLDAARAIDSNAVVFLSSATNLVPNDTNNQDDVFVRDIAAGTTTRVSVSSDGSEANGDSGSAGEARSCGLTPDGRLVGFRSDATNLVADDTNGQSDIFVHDRQTGETIRVSLTFDGGQSNGFSNVVAFSRGGTYMAFHSDASNLVPDDTNGVRDIFVRRIFLDPTTARVSVSDDGVQGNGPSSFPYLRDDGITVSFGSEASNLVPDDTNGVKDVFRTVNPLLP